MPDPGWVTMIHKDSAGETQDVTEAAFNETWARLGWKDVTTPAGKTLASKAQPKDGDTT